jgi:hypothetical protein
MGKRGPKPKSKVKIKWSADFAYAIGLIATDGNVSPDGRHVSFTSKDIEQIDNYQKALGINCHIGRKSSGSLKKKKYYVLQFSDIFFYNFLESIGLTQRKSLTIGEIDIPEKLFFDFLRGCFDGDGCSYSYWDPRWKSSFMFYISFASGSIKFITWLRKEIDKRLKIKSHIGVSKTKTALFYQLKYSKYAAVELVKKMYDGKKNIFLKRKKLKINKCLGIMGLKDI